MSEVQRLAALVAKLDQRLAGVERERRLSHASMEGGAVNVYQPGTRGRPGVALGQQYDGTYAPVPLGGPSPPTPSAPSSLGGVERLLVRYDGTFAAGPLTVAPMDYARVEVHVSETNSPGVLFETLRGTIESARGGEVSITGLAPDTDYYVWLVARSQAGKFSTPSEVVGPVRVTRLTVDDIDLDVFGGNTVHRGPDTPDPPHKVGDLWLRTTDGVALRWQGDPPDWLPVPDQASTVAAIEAMFAEVPDADRVRRINNESIMPGSLVARDVIATGTVSAGLLEAIMVLATTIIAGDPNGTHARMTPTGFRVFRPDANGDGIPDEVVRLGTDTDDNFAIVRANGSLAAAIDSSGAGTLSALTVSRWPVVAAADYTGRGGSLLDVLDRRPRGLVGWGSDTGTWESNTTAGRGIFDVAARLYYGRMYKITVKCRVNGTVQNDALAEIQVRWTESEQGSNLYTPPPPAAPTINSPIAGRYQTSIARAEAQGVVFSKPFSYGPGQPDVYRDVRFLLCLARPVGSTTISMYGAGDDITELIIEDVGPYLTPTKTLNDGGGTVQNPGPPPAPQTQRYTRSWVGTWHQNWLPSGAFIDLPGASQGRDPSNGNMRSYLGFSGAATDGSGLGMDHIIGAQIESVWLYLYSWHWYYNDGGPAIIGMHGFRNPAPGFGGGNEWMVGGVWFNKPGFNWVDLGPAGFGNWADGTWKGIMLGSTLAGADSLRNYGRFTDETDPNNKPVITVTYRR